MLEHDIMYREYITRWREDLRKLPKTFEEDPKMFRSWTNEFKYNLRDKLDISEIIEILTSEDMEIRDSSPGCSFVWIFTSGVFSS